MAKRRQKTRGVAAQTAPAAGAPAELCPACGSAHARPLFVTTDRLYRTTREKFQVVECGGCRLLRLHPRPGGADLLRYQRPGSFPKGTSFADRLERGYRRLLVSDEANFVLHALERAGIRGPVLDVSLEGSVFRRALAAAGIEVIAADAGPAGLEAAPVKAGSCAAVTMLHVLEHVENPAATVETAAALLQPGGLLFVEAPNAACWQFLLFGASWSGIDVPRHLLHFRASDLEALLDACGFAVRRRRYFSLRNPARFATTAAPWLDPAVRRARGTPEGACGRVLRHLLYLGLMLAAVPFTVLEGACRAGSTTTLEAVKKC